MVAMQTAEPALARRQFQHNGDFFEELGELMKSLGRSRLGIRRPTWDPWTVMPTAP